MNRAFQYIILFSLLACSLLISCSMSEGRKKAEQQKLQLHVDPPSGATKPSQPGSAMIDTVSYKSLVRHLVHDTAKGGWPVKTAYPLPGALLPYYRIVAYYGNFYSAGMGILGKLPPQQMLAQLRSEAAKWQQADTSIPVLPAIHYIAVTAQRSPGKDHRYRLRMPFTEITKAIELAKSINGIVFLDVQVGHSTVEDEIPRLDSFLLMPDVHLAIDPEFSMKDGSVPCSKIGTLDAADVNYAVAHLATLVRNNHLPPKILIVHRFTKGMLTNYRSIRTCPEVQIVVNMDGFGFPAKKVSSYDLAIRKEPVQFAGFKLFYQNDKLTRPYRLMQQDEILKLYPSPIYIQYQ